MKAEEIVEQIVDELMQIALSKEPDAGDEAKSLVRGSLVATVETTVTAFREAGLLLEWRTDVENAPDGTNNVVILHDGVHTTKGRCLMTEGRSHMTNTVWETVENDSYGEVFTMEPTLFAIIKPPEQTND